MANTKLKKQELDQLATLQNRKQAALLELGQVEQDRLILEERRRNILRYMEETRNIENQLAKMLEDTYGKGMVDVDKGEFISSEPPKAVSKKKQTAAAE